MNKKIVTLLATVLLLSLLTACGKNDDKASNGSAISYPSPTSTQTGGQANDKASTNGSDTQSTQGQDETQNGQTPATQPTNGGNMNQQPANGGNMNQQPANGGNMNQQPANGGNMNQQPANGGNMNQQPANGGNMNQQPGTSGGTNGNTTLQPTDSTDQTTTDGSNQ